MGKILISIGVMENKAKSNVSAAHPNIYDLSLAIAQLDLIKLNLLGKIAKESKINGLEGLQEKD